ncbi:MAG: hypothetical protein AAF517_27040, partial [Planctomycetota bacterium]
MSRFAVAVAVAVLVPGSGLAWPSPTKRASVKSVATRNPAVTFHFDPLVDGDRRQEVPLDEARGSWVHVVGSQADADEPERFTGRPVPRLIRRKGAGSHAIQIRNLRGASTRLESTLPMALDDGGRLEFSLLGSCDSPSARIRIGIVFEAERAGSGKVEWTRAESSGDLDFTDRDTDRRGGAALRWSCDVPSGCRRARVLLSFSAGRHDDMATAFVDELQ